MRRDNWIALIIIGLIIIIALAIYFTFFYAYKCNDLACFQAHQKKCVRTSFVNDEEDTTWKYLIKGKSSGKCIVNVEVLNIKKGERSKQILIGKEMDCYLPIGSAVSPESDIAICHGVLKEELQNLIIQKMHSYIVENLGEISEELEKVI